MAVSPASGDCPKRGLVPHVRSGRRITALQCREHVEIRDDERATVAAAAGARSFPFHAAASGSQTSTWMSEPAVGLRRACTRQNARGAAEGRGSAPTFAPAAKCCAFTTTPEATPRPVKDSQSAALADETIASTQDNASAPASCRIALPRSACVPISRSPVFMSVYLWVPIFFLRSKDAPTTSPPTMAGNSLRPGAEIGHGPANIPWGAPHGLPGSNRGPRAQEPPDDREPEPRTGKRVLAPHLDGAFLATRRLIDQRSPRRRGSTSPPGNRTAPPP